MYGIMFIIGGRATLLDQISILHLSDLHMSFEDRTDLRIVINALLADVERLMNDLGLAIDCICFTGDLVQRGDRADEQFQLALDDFILPLCAVTGTERFFMVPGNHDVDRSKIDSVVYSGIMALLTDSEAITEFLDNSLKDDHLRSIGHCWDFYDLLDPEPIYRDQLALAYKFGKNSKSVGIACLNSAWLSKDSGDRGRLVVGERQVERVSEVIEECDLRIALMHHPTSWLHEDDRPVVQAALARNFHLVLSGHLHQLEAEQIINPMGRAINLVAGALSRGRVYNGYSIISVNPHTMDTTVRFRQYFDTRRAFDKALEIADSGLFQFSLEPRTKADAIAFTIVDTTRMGFASYANSNLVSRLIDTGAPQALDEVFVEPLLSPRSDYRKEEIYREGHTPADDTVSFDEIIDGDDNVLFIGNTETGKTTLLHAVVMKLMEQFGSRGQVPFYIDVRLGLRGENAVLRALETFIITHGNGEQAVPRVDLEELLERGGCVICFDNIDFTNGRELNHVKSFMSSFPNNRFLMTTDEDLLQTMSLKEFPDFDCEYRTLYIRPLTKSRMRAFIRKWHQNQMLDGDDLLERLVAHFDQSGLPRTPLLVSLFLAIYRQYQEQAIYNEASVMERFMEMILEKLSPEDARTGAYDFRLKEDYLAVIAWAQVERRRALTEDEYNQITEEYFRDKGLDRRRSGFDKLFFEKGILLTYEGHVYFRYRCLAEYYTAKRAQNDRSILEKMLAEDDFLRFANSLSYLSGLDRNRADLLDFVHERVREALAGFQDAPVENLGDDYLETEIGTDIDPDSLLERSRQERLDEETRDRLTDRTGVQPGLQQQRLDSPDMQSERDFLSLLGLFARLIRNSELLSRDVKLEAVRTCSEAFLALLSAFKHFVNEVISDENWYRATDDQQENFEGTSPAVVRDVLRVVLPVVLQNMLGESMGSSKLEIVLREAIATEDDAFAKFMLTFIYSDLKLSDSISLLEQLVHEITASDVLLVVLCKLLAYHHLDHFRGAASERLEVLIAETTTKRERSPKMVVKGRLIDQLRQDRIRRQATEAG